jgi:hypothetical protein
MCDLDQSFAGAALFGTIPSYPVRPMSDFLRAYLKRGFTDIIVLDRKSRVSILGHTETSQEKSIDVLDCSKGDGTQEVPANSSNSRREQRWRLHRQESTRGLAQRVTNLRSPSLPLPSEHVH